MPIKPISTLPMPSRAFVNKAFNRTLANAGKKTETTLFSVPDSYLASKDKMLFEEPRYYYTTEDEFQKQQKERFISIKSFFSSFQKGKNNSESYTVNDNLLLINTHSQSDTFDSIRIRKTSEQLHDSKLNFEVGKIDIVNCKIISDIPKKFERFTFRKLHLHPEKNPSETLIETGEGLCKSVEDALLSKQNRSMIDMTVENTRFYFNPYIKDLSPLPETKIDISKAVSEDFSALYSVLKSDIHTRNCDYRITLLSDKVRGRAVKAVVEGDKFPKLTVDGVYSVNNTVGYTHDAPRVNFDVTVLKDANGNKYSIIDRELANTLISIHNMPSVYSKAFECEKLQHHFVM